MSERPKATEKPGWCPEHAGTWALRIPTGKSAVIQQCADSVDGWRVTILVGGRSVAVGSFADFESARIWSERELYEGRPSKVV